MKVGTFVRAGVVLGVLGAVWLAYDSYDALIIADKACLRAHKGSPGAQAKAHLRQIAASRGVEVIESGDRTTAIFPTMLSSGKACTFRVEGGVVIEREVGVRPVPGLRK